MHSPCIFVVTSVANGQAFLAEAIENILRQKLYDFEFLVIDDGSTDRIGKILAGHVAWNGRVRVLRHESNKRAASLNIGIGLATGKYIARIDREDQSHGSRPTKDTRQVTRSHIAGWWN